MNEITLLYVHNRAMGYGRLGVDLAAAVKAHGVTVYDHLGTPPPSQHEDSEMHVSQGHVGADSPTNVVCWVSTPSHARWWWQGQYAAVFTMWEASVLPPAFRESLHELDMLIVPSMHNVDLFSRYHKNVVYNPLGVDPARWHYTPRRESRYFDFLIGGSGPRKGTDLAFAAFRKVFGDWTGSGRVPRLVMKNPKGEAKFRGFDRVDIVSGRLTDDEEVALYETAAVYVQPSRGEGFGLQPLQAMAQGIPTILTDAHGHGSFAKHGIPLDWSWSKADYFIFGDAGDWWEPDFEQLCEAMWDTYHNYDRHKGHASRIAEEVIPGRFTWDACARRFLGAFGTKLDEPYTGDGTYKIPTRHQYRVRVSRAWRADVGGATHIWQPGVDYYETADIKRILFEAEVLDPECLQGDDHGLTKQQIARLGAYSAAQEWCPTCHQRLGSGVAHADEIHEGMEAQAAMVRA